MKPLNWLQYALLASPLAMLGLPIYMYLPSYYAEHFSLSFTAIGLALLLARSLDVITDPLIGYWSDRVQTVISRKKQIIIGSILLTLFINPLLTPFNNSVSWLQLFTLSFLSYFAWTMIQIPYLALAAELECDPLGKTHAVTAREGFAIIGVLITLLLPFILETTVTSQKFYENFLVLFMAILFISLLWLFYIPVSNQSVKKRQTNDGHPSYSIRHIKHRHPEALVILSPYFFNNLANAIPATLFLIFVEQYLELKDSTGHFLMAYFLAGLASLPIWLLLAKKLGRLVVWRASILLAIISFSLVFFLENKDYTLYMIICVFTGLSLGVDIALPASIQTEIGNRIAQQNHNVNGFLFGLWGMLTKLSLALAVGVSLPILDMVSSLELEKNTSLLLLYGMPAILLKIWVWLRLIDVRKQLPMQNL